MGQMRVVASGDRARRYRESGVFVNERQYFFPVCAPGDETAPADLFIFSVKHNDLERAVADAKNQIGPDTVILSLLNGITSEREISNVYGAKHMLLSTVIKTSATRREDLAISSKFGVIQFGDANQEGGRSEDVRRVAEFFGRSGIPCEIHDDMNRTLWKKFMLNVGLNQTSALLRFPYGLMQASAFARDTVIAAMEEVVSLAPFEGVALNPDDVRDALALINGLQPDGKTSMLQDIESLRPTEVGILGEAVVELGHVHGVPTPVNRTLSRLLRAIEESYAA